MDEEEWMQEAGAKEPKQIENQFMVAYNDTTAPSSSSKKERSMLEISCFPHILLF